MQAHFASFGVTNIQHFLATTQQFVESDTYHSLGEIGLVFVDGYHSEEQARFDYEAFRDKLTPDGVALIEFSSSKAPRVIGMIDVCSTQMGPPSALAVAPDYSFVLAACPQKFGPDKKLTAANTVAVIGLDDPSKRWKF